MAARNKSPWKMIVTVVTSSLFALTSGAVDAGDDPLEWRAPSAKAEFRNLLSDADYTRLSAAMKSRLPKAIKEAATKIPDHGVKINTLFSPGAFEKDGVTGNDVIVAINGEELWGRGGEPELQAVRARVYVARQDRFRELRVSTHLNNPLLVFRRPELAYLRSKDRGARWDADAFVGLVAAPSDPTLAETAWHHAIALGAPRSRRCLASGAELALAQGRPETAADFWYEAEHNGGSEPLDPLLAYRVMIANFKLEQARDLARKHPNFLSDAAEGLDELIAAHRGRPQKERTLPPPSALAKRMHRRDARKQLIGLSENTEGGFLQPLMKRDVFQANPVSENFVVNRFQLDNSIRDFEFRLAMTMFPTDNRRSMSVKLANLDLNGVRATDVSTLGEYALLGHIRLEVPSGLILMNCVPGNEVYFPDPLIITDGKVKNRIRVLRVGDQQEVFINERRVLYQPVLADVRLQALQFHVAGVTIVVSEFALDELIPRL